MTRTPPCPHPADAPLEGQALLRPLTPLIAALAVALCSCATIVGSATQVVPIASTPSEAKVVIVDEDDKEVFSGVTPASVTLAKHHGGYWGKKSFKVTVTKDGYKPQTIPITAAANGWYMFGNFFFGGLIGWFAVDPFSGKMYTLSPETIKAEMAQDSAHNNRATDGSIAIVLLQDVPQRLRAQLVPVN